jgi:transposase-like protein
VFGRCVTVWTSLGGVDATSSSLYRGHRFPVEIISHCVWLYHRFPLSLRDVEEMMAQRGVSVSYDTGCRGFWNEIRR